MPNSIVRFRRTGGVATTPDTLTVISDDAGRFVLTLAAHEVGEVIATVITTPGVTKPQATFRGARLRVQYRRADRVGAVYPVGRLLTYSAEIYFRGTDSLLRNTDVFRPALAASPSRRRRSSRAASESTLRARAAGRW